MINDNFFWTNRQLAEAGAHVVMAVRNPKAAQELIHKWQNEWSGLGLPLNVEVFIYLFIRNFISYLLYIYIYIQSWVCGVVILVLKVMELDLLSLESVVRFSEAWNARSGPLHVLINNAGMFSIGGWCQCFFHTFHFSKKKFFLFLHFKIFVFLFVFL